jgi:hypothetical protein
VEGWYPLAFGAITCFGLAHFAVSDEVFRSIMDRVMPTAISVAAILAGFQGAGQAVLLGILESGTISYLKRTGHYKRLVLFLWRAILLLFGAIRKRKNAMAKYHLDSRNPCRMFCMGRDGKLPDQLADVSRSASGKRIGRTTTSMRRQV